MKILSAKQIKEADKLTLEKQGISSIELMERAATMVFEEIHKRLQGAPIPVKIFCGIGNNGGDGLVVGRQLMKAGYDVTIYVVNYSDQRSRDFLTNYDRIKSFTKNWPILLKSEDDFPEINYGDFVVDAIFGVGLNRPLPNWVAGLVRHINASGAFVLAIDIPSGLMADAGVEDLESIIRASYTITFQVPKMAFYLPRTAPLVGDLQILDIGLDTDFLKNAPAVAELISRPEARALYTPRHRFTHKGTYGHALIIGGSYGKIGSVCLSATAAMRAGAGLVTVYAPQCGYNIIQISVPEAMVLTDPHVEILTNIEFDLEPDVIGFGIGVGTKEETIEAFEKLLRNYKKPMVIDADGLNILSKKNELLKLVPEGSILTPHPKELERLIGSWKDDFEKLEKARSFSKQYNVIVLIKGTYTIVVTPNDLFINTTGNPGMATAGSGDVLTGVLTALVGQGYEPLRAAVLGAYLHGKAGDLAAKSFSYEGIVAGDVAKNTGPAILDLFETEKTTNS